MCISRWRRNGGRLSYLLVDINVTETLNLLRQIPSLPVHSTGVICMGPVCLPCAADFKSWQSEISPWPRYSAVRIPLHCDFWSVIACIVSYCKTWVTIRAHHSCVQTVWYLCFFQPRSSADRLKQYHIKCVLYAYKLKTSTCDILSPFSLYV